jgi:hypothetical protein
MSETAKQNACASAQTQRQEDAMFECWTCWTWANPKLEAAINDRRVALDLNQSQAENHRAAGHDVRPVNRKVRA